MGVVIIIAGLLLIMAIKLLLDQDWIGLAVLIFVLYLILGTGKSSK